ncbi:hypothetical protein IJT93_12255 [bacterium]|nr:hypothetical protein [bacterium]
MNDINSASFLNSSFNGLRSVNTVAECPQAASVSNHDTNSEHNHSVEDSVNIGVRYDNEENLESVAFSARSDSAKAVRSEVASDKFQRTDSKNINNEFDGFLISGNSSSIMADNKTSNSFSLSSLGTIAIIDDPQTPEELLSSDMVMNGPSFAKYGIYNMDGDRIA